jgi:sortase A
MAGGARRLRLILSAARRGFALCAPDAAQRGRFLFVLLIPLCAIGPWLVPWPWQQHQQTPTSDPSSIIRLARSQAVTGRKPGVHDREVLPTERTVRGVAAAARAGYDVPVPAGVAAKVRTTPGRYQPLGRIQITRIGLDVAFGEGVYAKALERGPGHWPGTPMPGQDGNSVLSGHRNTHTAPFKLLNLLRPGDKIEVAVKGEKKVTFRVDGTTIVKEAKFKDFVLRQPKDPRARSITLFACHPAGHPVFRIVVRATA